MESNKELVSIPYFVHEGDMDRADRTNKRLTVALVLTIVLMFLSNGIWLYEWMQYDYVSEDEETVTTMYEQEGSGTNIMGNHNEVNNGTTNDHDSDEAEDEIEDPEVPSYSFAPPPADTLSGLGNSEFAQSVEGKTIDEVWPVLEELMEVIEATNTGLYHGVIRKLKKLGEG